MSVSNVDITFVDELDRVALALGCDANMELDLVCGDTNVAGGIAPVSELQSL